MPRYLWLGPNAAEIPDAGVVAQPNEEFDSPVDLNHPYAQLVSPPKAKPADKEA